ncbi:MAG: hypothetical protein MJ239_03220 [Bacilli bacterium]|nr:hypothetical protein [Bacilli bacterium]
MIFDLRKTWETIVKYYFSSPETYWPLNDPFITEKEMYLLEIIPFEHHWTLPWSNEYEEKDSGIFEPYKTNDYLASFLRRHRSFTVESWENALVDRVGLGMKTLPKDVDWKTVEPYKTIWIERAVDFLKKEMDKRNISSELQDQLVSLFKINYAAKLELVEPKKEVKKVRFDLDELYKKIQKYYRSSPQTYWPTNDLDLTYQEFSLIRTVEKIHDTWKKAPKTISRGQTIPEYLDFELIENDWLYNYLGSLKDHPQKYAKKPWDKVLVDKVGNGVKTEPKGVNWKKIEPYRTFLEIIDEIRYSLDWNLF